MAYVYVVEDDKNISEIESFALKNAGHTVVECASGKEFHKLMRDRIPDMILLDVMLPDEDGLEILRKIRQTPETRRVPVIMVTAKTTELDKVKGLDLGADDYITKPFSLIVLISKVNAFMRRIGNTIIENIIFCDKLKFDYVENKLTKDKEEILLSKNEGKLLKYLMENSSQTVTKEKLMEALWDIDGNFVDENTVAVNIRRLRQKVEDNPSEPEYIKNIRGVGYTFAKRCIKK